MVIGFTQRIQTVSENDVGPVSSFLLDIDVAILRPSEQEYEIIYRLISSGTATVAAFDSFLRWTDAFFGSQNGDSIKQYNIIYPGETVINSLVTMIVDDFIPEEEECYTIRITQDDISGSLRNQFTCTNDLVNSNFFCTHTICIEDDDGKNVLISGFDLILLLDYRPI